MKITDKEAIRELNLINDEELFEDVREYPEDERDGRNDLDFIADEISYFISCYEEDGHAFCEDLERAKRIMKETQNGKVMPMYTGTIVPKYSRTDISNARDAVNTYRRFKNSMKRLNAKGIYGKW
jgi:hypothetical protein